MNEWEGFIERINLMEKGYGVVILAFEIEELEIEAFVEV